VTIHSDQHGFEVQCGRPALSQTIAVGAGSLQSAPFQTGTPGRYDSTGAPITTPNFTTHVRLVSTSNCWVQFGTNPVSVAQTSPSILLIAGVPEYFWVVAGERVSVIQDTAAGILNIAELAQ
jgi:hypothetical protein